MRYLNGFVVLGVVLFLISMAGMVYGNTLLTEPGLPVNHLARWEYLAASVLMLVNGVVSIRMMQRHTGRREGSAAGEGADTGAKRTPAP
ncbi:MAG TPA: hypothetical protein VLH79_08730 [Chthonomonadales bacterium]|nr:hypothetical protein [Chthonomonadales bacterium]